MSADNLQPSSKQQPSKQQQVKPLRISFLVSGNGSNLQVLIDAMQAGAMPIEIVGVISNRDDAYAIKRAQQANIPVAILSHTESGKRMGIKTFETHASAQLAAWQPDLIVLAGFMRVLSAGFTDNSPAPIINLHPALLPAYKGLDTHQRALQTGERYHGCSIHVVTAELDAGQVLTQALLHVNPKDSSDSLQARVQALEHQLLPWTILLLAKGVLPLNANDTPSEKISHLPVLPLRLWLDN
ncbi:phosphoribosylglycinamide formyltransferase [Psychrobacter sp. CAL346-MNA-CIBAN-0220]|uniref:phosphoribosylglycinamide formyltransferase n=1 Tax=Psychrobacter sp. CAL346-MNA-CIBAN-0220 TaxID=3140457 RepID=UPI00332C8ED6